MKGRDIGEEVLVKHAIAVTSAVAGGTGDATEIAGITVNRSALGSLFESAKLSIVGNATLASGETLTVVANLQDSADASAWADFGTAYTVATVLDAAGGALTASSFEVFLDNDLRGARQYVRAQITPNLSAANTDTALIDASLVLGGATVYPAA